MQSKDVTDTEIETQVSSGIEKEIFNYNIFTLISLGPPEYSFLTSNGFLLSSALAGGWIFGTRIIIWWPIPILLIDTNIDVYIS